MNTLISVFGLGLMGRPIARGLIAAGYNICGWNRTPLPKDLVNGIPICRDIKQAARAEVCLLMLADTQAVDIVLFQLEPHLSAGQLILEMGTSDPSRSKYHAHRLAAKGIGWVDAPVSGGVEGAVARTLTIMAGGTNGDFLRVKKILDSLGSNVVHVGGPGAGHTVKLINQVITGLTVEAVAEALTLTEKLGVDPTLVQQALKGGFADSKVLQVHGSRMIQRAYNSGGKADRQLKNLRLALDLANAMSIKLPHLESLVALNETLIKHGGSEMDISALHMLLWS
jgi:3-hydroxyisobutyrate dehydrogenase-like beta-hydroxyacid dehydrogenase